VQGARRAALVEPRDQLRVDFDGELDRLRSALGSGRKLMLEFGSDPGALNLTTAKLTADEGLRKHYLLDREDVSLIHVLGEIGSDRGLKDIALEEPGIEEVIRTFYQGRNAALAAP